MWLIISDTEKKVGVNIGYVSIRASSSLNIQTAIRLIQGISTVSATRFGGRVDFNIPTKNSIKEGKVLNISGSRRRAIPKRHKCRGFPRNWMTLFFGYTIFVIETTYRHTERQRHKIVLYN